MALWRGLTENLKRCPLRVYNTIFYLLFYLEHGDGLGVEAPVVPLLHDVLVGEMDHPTLLDCL